VPYANKFEGKQDIKDIIANKDKAVDTDTIMEKEVV
jgi:hypothetical protein